MSSSDVKEKSILCSKYIPCERPMSKNEIKYEINKFMRDNKISNEKVIHTKTKYQYHVKKFGKKEKELLENKSQNIEDYNLDIGNCSVTWKLSKTPGDLKQNAKHIISEYMSYNDEKRDVDHFYLELTKIFYTWLYLEHYD